MKTIRESEKLSIARCRAILKENGKQFTDEEIILMRNWLYQLAELSFQIIEDKNENEIDLLKEQTGYRTDKRA